MKALRIAPELALPLDVVTEKLAFLGRTGSGKSYAAQKLAEEMFAAEAQFVVLDPVGIWWSLRLAADGKRPGLAIPVLGGLHGDIPLEVGAGALIANLVVDRGVSMVLDVSQFESDADKARFAQAFADRFFFRKKAAPSAVHVFIEEAQEFVPQNPQREEARMLHAFTRLEKLGRNFGIGASLISQRPQEVNKKALNQIELLFAFQMTGPQERKTVEGWIAEKGVDEDIAGELPKLARGGPHVWSPAWLKISKVVSIAEKWTFDASSTPTVGKKQDARPLAPIDLEKLKVDMAATIEKAKAEDPRELRRRIAELEAAVKKSRQPVTEKVTATKRVEVPVLKDAQVKRLEYLTGNLEKILAKLDGWRAALDDRGREIKAAAAEITATVRAKLTPAPISPRMELVRQQQRGTDAPAKILTRATAVMVSPGVDGPQQRILDTIAMLNVRGLVLSRETIARWMALHPNGGRYNRGLAALRADGYLDGFQLTDLGLEIASAPAETGPAGALAALPDETKRRLLGTILDVGHALSREDLAAKLGLHPNGGRYNRDLAWLRTMGVIPERGLIAPTEGLFR